MPRPDRPALRPRKDETPEERPRFLRRRRAEAAAALVPLAALFVLMPPFVRIFAHDGRVLGAPVVLLFLLGLWIAVIVATRILARRLLRPDAEP